MLWLFLILFIPGGLNQFFPSAYIPWRPCDGYEITIVYEQPPPDKQNQYSLNIEKLPETRTLILKFDSEVTLEPRYLTAEAKEKLSIQKLVKPRNGYRLSFPEDFGGWDLRFQVFGPASGTVPYIESILRDYYEICKNPKTGYLEKYINLENEESVPVDKSCGRRKVIHTQLIVHGQSTDPGDWPWHVAIIRVEKFTSRYICGGTLLSKTLVLTAGHCASIRGNAVVPDVLSVHLGKHNLIGGDLGAQEREVFRVIIHPNFSGTTLDNDIALLKLKSEAVINDYVQPACLWYKEAKNRLPDSQSIFGTVAGWGFDHHDSPSSTLQKTTIPIVSELTCLKSNPTFFHQKLNDNKFCAGFANGTSVCNGDSGGGLTIFVPDSSGETDTTSGGWYVRGIVSVALRRKDAPICDPFEYTIFTDVEKYRDWLLEYMG